MFHYLLDSHVQFIFLWKKKSRLYSSVVIPRKNAIQLMEDFAPYGSITKKAINIGNEKKYFKFFLLNLVSLASLLLIYKTSYNDRGRLG